MMQKRTLYSLLLTFMILVCAFSFSLAQVNEVTIQSKGAKRCEAGTLNISVTNADSISAVEIVLEVRSGSGGAFFDAMSVQWDPGFTGLTNRIIDTSQVDHVDPDTVIIAAMRIAPGDHCLAAGGPMTVAKVQFHTNNVCSGTVLLNGVTKTHTNCCHPFHQTMFCDCPATTSVLPAVNMGTVTIQNVAPTLDPIADDSIHWGSQYRDTAWAHDLDLPNGCEKLTFSKCDGPAGLTVTKISDTAAVLVWNTTSADICYHSVCVKVTDSCGASAQKTFSICVYNLPPQFCANDTCCTKDTSRFVWGDTAHGDVDATDPDGGPAGLAYTLLSFTGPGAQPTVDPITGEWKWPTELFDHDYLGVWQLCILVSDAAPTCPPCSPSNADTCCVYIEILKNHVYIQKTTNTLLGQFEEVSIHLDDFIPGEPYLLMGGFDFLISYDASVLTFQYADPGNLLDTCKWEYFTYRFGQFGNCAGGPCPSGIVRVVAMAETNNGPHHPICFGNVTQNELVKLHFYVTSDLTYECMFFPIKFVWYDCGDNTISSKDGDSLYISQRVFDYVGGDAPQGPQEVTGPYGTYFEVTKDTTFPTFFGAPGECDDTIGTYWSCKQKDQEGNCIDSVLEYKAPWRLINFFNGGIDVYCIDTLDDRGDINLNGVKNEVADAVMFTNYFIYGMSVFKINPLAQVAATDVNADGLTLSVADLVYLTRIITGDALPYPKVVTSVQATYVHGSDGIMRVSNDVVMGAAFVVVRGDVTPELLAPEMDMKYACDGEQTRILVYSLEGHGFTGEFLHVNGEVVSVEMATYEGNPVVAKLIPSDFALHQNYPNPFNPTTTISFSLPTATDYTLTIYNVSGQQVEQFVGSHEAGVVEIAWEAGDLASGVYFYKLVAGSFSDTKKMVLLK